MHFWFIFLSCSFISPLFFLHFHSFHFLFLHFSFIPRSFCCIFLHFSFFPLGFSVLSFNSCFVLWNLPFFSFLFPRAERGGINQGGLAPMAIPAGNLFCCRFRQQFSYNSHNAVCSLVGGFSSVQLNFLDLFLYFPFFLFTFLYVSCMFLYL